MDLLRMGVMIVEWWMRRRVEGSAAGGTIGL